MKNGGPVEETEPAVHVSLRRCYFFFPAGVFAAFASGS
jgi:hypothetical protein